MLPRGCPGCTYGGRKDVHAVTLIEEVEGMGWCESKEAHESCCEDFMSVVLL